MSIPEGQTSLPGSAESGRQQSSGSSSSIQGVHRGKSGLGDRGELRALDAHTDARSIARLIQCQFCSLLLQTPIILPCGNGLCRRCLPEPYKRENITYPMLPNRQEGFMCPFEDCRQEHAIGDCSSDVTLTKVLDRVGELVDHYRPLSDDTPTLLDEKLHWRNMMTSNGMAAARSQMLHGGRLLSTLTMIELGELKYDSDVFYKSMSPAGDSYRHLDQAFLDNLTEIVRNEMECEVCYALMLDPLTTPCGHTFCRKCVIRVLDHSATCPICRRSLNITPGVSQEPSNKRLSKLLLSLIPDQVTARAKTVEAEEAALTDASRVPLFICTLSYPGMPTFLHIFEPRYRLMVRRAMETDRKFGMVLYNRTCEPQGELGISQFVQYGTLLHIQSMQLLPDGRSLIETRGVSRFKVLEHSVQDGYAVARVERVDDIPLAEEEALEVGDVSTAHPPDSGGVNGTGPALAGMSTADLMAICTNWVTQMRDVAVVPWLSNSVLAAYGNMPEDPAIFPFWFASVLPIKEIEKYRLLPARSVRERLKITAGWVRRVQGIR